MKLNLPQRILLLGICMLLGIQTSAQTLNKPEPADNPNLPGNSAWTAACASSGFNEYFVNFTWSPPLVQNANEFILELSNASGDFENPIELDRVSNMNTTFDFDFDFALPTDTRGEGYRFRVRSTSPELTSLVSDAYPMYYIDYDTPILISQDGNGTIPPGGSIQVCDGSSVTLAPHNVANASTYQYNWYRSGTLLTEKESTITVSQTGMYYVEIDYGSVCSGSANTLSNTIEITTGTSQGIALNQPSKTALCPGETETLQASITGSGLTYTWYKDGAAITSPIVDEDSYTVDVSGEINNTLTVNQVGSYFARVTESGGACAASPVDSEPTEIVAPESFEFLVDYTTSYTSCSSTDVTIGLAQINAVTSNGEKTDVTSQIAANFSYQWNKDGSAVSGETNNTILVANTTDNGEYTLSGVIETYDVISNIISVRLRTNENIEINSTGTVFCTGGDTIVLTTNRNLTGDTYEWQRNGSVIDSSTDSYTVSEEGTYRLIVTIDGCEVPSNEIIVTNFDDSQLTFDSDTALVFPEGESFTINASGADAYEWYDANNTLISSNSSATLTEEGEYILLANIGDCQATRTLTVEYQDNFRVPNVITANGDGINDLWVLPNTYSRKDDVIVTIYNEKGQEIYNEPNYQNNWPGSNTQFSKQNMVFYYKIQQENKTIKQGTITVIR